MKVYNFGSRYAGWGADVTEIVQALRDPVRLRAAIPTIAPECVLARIDDLSYYVLIDRLQLSQTVTVFQCVEDDSSGTGGNDPLFAMLAAAEDAPAGDDGDRKESEREPSDDGFDEDFPPDQDDDGNSSAVIRPGAHGSRPRYLRPVGQGVTIDVIVDCYGMYVTSLQSWLERMINYIKGRAARRLLDRMKSGEMPDGPGVLLCPELIDTIAQRVMRTATLPVRRALAARTNPTRLFLQLTLLHEIGHHVFPVHGSHEVPLKAYLSEALANWFVYSLVGSFERAALLEKSAGQSREYRAYRGLVWLEHGAGGPLACCGPSGPEWVGMIERASFDRRLVGPSLDDEMSRNFPDWPECLFEMSHFPWHHRHGSQSRATVHEARVYGAILIREAIPHAGHELTHALDRSWRRSNMNVAISKPRQRAWLDAVSALPRRLPPSV